MNAAIITERVTIPVSDGTTMGGHIARPSGEGARPAVLLLQEIFGLNPHIRDLAERLARESYAVLAPDLFHRIQPDFVGSYDDIPAGIAMAMKYGPEDSEADLRASADYLRRQPFVKADKVGVIGYCMGGRLAFVAGAVGQLAAIVSFYGNIAPDKLSYAPSLQGPALLVWAGDDAYIPRDKRLAVGEALRAHGKEFVEVEFAGKKHGFFCDARSDYDAHAASVAWPLTTAFLRTHLGA
jgi:carboxymethylenebutenolidase